MQSGQRPAPLEAFNGHSHTNNLKFFPSMTDKSSPEHGLPIPRQDRYPAGHPSTATEVEEAEDDTGGTTEQSEIMKRLQEIEKRQERIENLLGQIASSIGKN